ncbi:MAG TPA: DUF393 domain-containing protein [Acidobacteria bacterium]|nr:DUF393 domain-containing protein [Acidobacteriota bacterium]
MRWVQRSGQHDDSRFIPNDPASVREASDNVDPVVAARTIVAVDDQGRVTKGAQAVFSIAADTGGIIGFISRLLKYRFVSLLFEPGYRVFARHRGRFAWFFREST